MKTPWIVTIVVLAHLVAVGGVILLQGCGTLTTPTQPPTATMPPSARPAAPAPTEPPAPKPAVTQWPVDVTTHVVARGESLSVIAHKYGLNVKELAAINGIDNPNKIFIIISQENTTVQHFCISSRLRSFETNIKNISAFIIIHPHFSFRQV